MSIPEQLLQERLETHTGTTALVGSRVRPIILRQDDTFPAITYQVTNTAFEYNHATGAANEAELTIEVTAHATTYAGAKALAKQVRLALSGWNDADSQVWHLHDEYDDVSAIGEGESTYALFQVIQSYSVTATLESS